MSVVRGWKAASVGCVLALAIGFGACGDDDEEAPASASSTPTEASAAPDGELLEVLPVAEDLGREPDREYEWDNAIDFVVQGAQISEATPPSEIVGALEEAGFERGAVVGTVDPTTDSLLRVLVAEFSSEEGATQAQEALHEEDLKQPCFEACTVVSSEYEVTDIPNAVAVHHEPIEGEPPPGVFVFEAYLLEFTVGSQLYVVVFDGPPGFTSSEGFDEVAQTVYAHVTEGA